MPHRNPIIPGFHPDPSICRVGDEYFLVTSSFTWFPGVPLFRSDDLVTWTLIGNVLDRPSQLDLSATSWSSGGVYAPTIRHHDGRFWMITTVVTDVGARLGNFFVTADDPAGPWSDPVPVDVMGVDPDLAWDAEGNCWVHFSSFSEISRIRMDDATGAVLEGPDPAWSGTGMKAPEAPHLFERDGLWYLLIAEGGTERGHAVSIARGPSPVGPWESNPANPILSHRSTNHPIQNTGHADLVESPDGSWWMVALGVRPRGMTPGFHVLGRETFLAAVEWVAGWPLVVGLEVEMQQAPSGASETRSLDVVDDFDGPSLHPRWIAHRRPPAQFCSLDARPGWLTLSGDAATLDSPAPSFLGRRQQHHACRVRSLVDPGAAAEAGLAVVYDEGAHYEIAVRGSEILARARVAPFETVLGTAHRPPGPIVLVIETVPQPAGPDVVHLGFESPTGDVQVLGAIDGRFLSTEVQGGFIGRVIGMYASGGEASFDYFAYAERTES